MRLNDPAGTPREEAASLDTGYLRAPFLQHAADTDGLVRVRSSEKRARPRVVVVMPAYNAARTLSRTYSEIPHDHVDKIILVDDGSTDETVKIATALNLSVYVHRRNFGYGANQKTCYAQALAEAADIVVMLHPDYQYDPTLLPTLVEPIARDEADVVLGSRLLVDDALKRGMPWWKYVANRFLTWVENRVLGLNLSEYHTGYRAYSEEFLRLVPFRDNSDRFVFDQEILVQAAHHGFRICEVPVPARYFPEASSASLANSVVYGLRILLLMARYILHRAGIIRAGSFEIYEARYKKVA